MVSRHWIWLIAAFTVSGYPTIIEAQQLGGIRGLIIDQDFQSPLGDAQIQIAETGVTALSSDLGNYVISDLEPGQYSVIISKEGYIRQIRANLVVLPGQLTEMDVWLSGEFTEMEEFIVQYLQIGSQAETALLELRFESPALMDSISSELMSIAGAGDAASALRLVAGASIQDGKYAVIRGLPDRYVNTQINRVRLPTSDEDKRAVQLDQFPSPAIDSIQVSKTFTPDQQGDASGGAVNIELKGIPDEFLFKLSGQSSFNTQVVGNNRFLTYRDRNLDIFGFDKTGIPATGQFSPIVGVAHDDAPIDYKWSIATGGKRDLNPVLTLGGFVSFFYERDSSYYDRGINDRYWVDGPGNPMSPLIIQGAPDQGDFKTQLFDITQGSEEVKWGSLGLLGLESEEHSLTFTHLYTRSAEKQATLAEDTRGKLHYFPDYVRDDPHHPGNRQRDAAPFLRTETLEYTERYTQMFQLGGLHQLPSPTITIDDIIRV